MSENENQPPAPSKQTSSIPTNAPSKQTSSVPLKKETVRVTLKAADAPPAVPSSTVPIAPAVRPPIAGAPPTPTVPGAPRRPMAPAPTIPLRTAGPPTAGGPAPTIRLAAPGSATVALKPAGGAATLPKATVQLQAPTRPLGTSFPSASQSATLKVEDDEEEEESANEGVANILAGVGLVAALALLTFQIMTASVWVSAPDNEKAGDWTQLSPF